MPLDIKGGVISPSSMSCDVCPLFIKCTFDEKRMGGFKGTRPHYVGYRLITDKTQLHAAKEDFITCFAFVEVLRDRMDTGGELRRAGEDGEMVTVFAQEGDMIAQHATVGFNSRGEIIKPQPHMVKALEAANYKVNLDDKSPAVTFDDVMYHSKVPVFTEQKSGQSAYAQLILQRELERQTIESGVDDAAWEASRQHMLAESARPVISEPAK